jgi:hypothetical protein
MVPSDWLGHNRLRRPLSRAAASAGQRHLPVRGRAAPRRSPPVPEDPPLPWNPSNPDSASVHPSDSPETSVLISDPLLSKSCSIVFHCRSCPPNVLEVSYLFNTSPLTMHWQGAICAAHIYAFLRIFCCFFFGERLRKNKTKVYG